MVKTYKIARTAIYSVLYGKQKHTFFAKGERPKKRSNVPEHDETRQMSTFWDYHAAKAVWDAFIGECKFSDQRKAFLAKRLETLRVNWKRKQQEPAE